jgi:hypothetical protein
MMSDADVLSNLPAGFEPPAEATAERAGELLALLEGSAAWARQRQQWANASPNSSQSKPDGGSGAVDMGHWFRSGARGGVAMPAWLHGAASRARAQLLRDAQAAALETAAARAAVTAGCSASGGGVHRVDEAQLTMLMRACKAGHLPLVKALLDHAAQTHQAKDQQANDRAKANMVPAPAKAPMIAAAPATAAAAAAAEARAAAAELLAAIADAAASPPQISSATAPAAITAAAARPLDVDGPREAKRGWAALHFAAQVRSPRGS